MEEKACVEVRGQLGGRSLTWAFPLVGGGEAPGGLRVFSLACPAKSSIREDFEVGMKREKPCSVRLKYTYTTKEWSV